MKTKNLLSKSLAGLALMLFSFTALAQNAPLAVTNNSGCYFLIDVVAVDGPACSATCAPAQVCVPPGATIIINPCGLPHWTWCMATVTPADPLCNPCPPGSSTSVQVAAPGDPCSGLTQTQMGKHCDPGCAGGYTAHFSSPNTLDIY